MATVRYHYGKFPPKSLDYQRLLPLVGPANAELARYDGILSGVPDAAVLLTPLTTQEAVLSSKIEGTQTTLSEVLEYEAGMPADRRPEKIGDIQEVLNYRRAIWEAIELLKTLPLSQRIVKAAHKVLLEGVRGKARSPGEYRKIQNWIGEDGTTVESARFVPISAEKLADGMSHWERFLHEEYPDRLVQLAVVHAEFEALHPFLDGNGRLGRMLVPLFLFAKGMLRDPVFYISAYFERHREAYYDRLLAVSQKDDWTGWVEYFLRSVIAQAKENNQKARAILDLFRQKQDEIPQITRSRYSAQVVNFLFRRPIFRSSDFIGMPEIPDPTAYAILKSLRTAKVLRTLQSGSGRRPAVYAFRELLNITEGYEAF